MIKIPIIVLRENPQLVTNLEEHFGFSVPPSVYVTSLLLFLPDLYFLNQFFVYKRLLEALERGYPSL